MLPQIHFQRLLQFFFIAANCPFQMLQSLFPKRDIFCNTFTEKLFLSLHNLFNVSVLTVSHNGFSFPHSYFSIEPIRLRINIAAAHIRAAAAVAICRIISVSVILSPVFGLVYSDGTDETTVLLSPARSSSSREILSVISRDGGRSQF